jgi:hypothetical protein
MSRSALSTKQNLDGIFIANPSIADRDKVIAHRVQAQIQNGLDIRIPAHLAKRYLIHFVVHLEIR